MWRPVCCLFSVLTVTCPARTPPDAVFALPVCVGVWGHTVVAAEVKEANEIDAVIGVVAPVGAAAVKLHTLRRTHHR